MKKLQPLKNSKQVKDFENSEKAFEFIKQGGRVITNGNKWVREYLEPRDSKFCWVTEYLDGDKHEMLVDWDTVMSILKYELKPGL
jgi:hypothetical protein